MIWLWLGTIAYLDLRYRTIPNLLILAGALLALYSGIWWSTLAWGICGAGIFGPMYVFGVIAGGDLKLCIVMAMILSMFGIYITLIALPLAWLMAGWTGKGQPFAAYVLGVFAILGMI